MNIPPDEKAHIAKSAEVLLRLSRRIIDASNKVPLSEELPEHERLLRITSLYLLARARQNLEAIIYLTNAGYSTQAMILARAIFEMAITLQYIMRDAPKRTLLYIEYELIERSRLIQSLNKWSHVNPTSLPPDHYEKQQEILAEAEKLKGNYPNKLSWSGKSLKDMCYELGGPYEYAYDITYLILCKHSHSSLMISRGNLKTYGDTITVFASSNPADEQPAIAAAITFLSSIAEDFNGIFGFGFKAELDVINEAFKRGAKPPIP